MEKAPGIDCRCTHRACNGKAHSAAIESNHQKSISRRKWKFGAQTVRVLSATAE